jgi:hypothetical protein
MGATALRIEPIEDDFNPVKVVSRLVSPMALFPKRPESILVPILSMLDDEELPNRLPRFPRIPLSAACLARLKRVAPLSVFAELMMPDNSEGTATPMAFVIPDSLSPSAEAALPIISGLNAPVILSSRFNDMFVFFV